MDLLAFPAQIQQKMFLFLDPPSLLNLVQCCSYFSNFLSSPQFLDRYCRREFGLYFRELPPLLPWQVLFVNTQRVMFQKKSIIDLNRVDRPLMTIYMMHLRITWAISSLYFGWSKDFSDWWCPPYLFFRPNFRKKTEKVNEDSEFVIPFYLFFQTEEESPNFENIRFTISNKNLEYLIRLHVAFPSLFDAPCLQTGSQFLFSGFSWYHGNDPHVYHREQVRDDFRKYFLVRTIDDCSCIKLDIEINDNNEWRLFYEQQMPMYSDLSAECVWLNANSTFEEIRQIAGEVLVDTFLKGYFLCDTPPCFLRTPTSRVFLDINLFDKFQKELQCKLDTVITSISIDLTKKLFPKINSRDRKVIQFLDSLLSCPVLDHDIECEKRYRSPNPRVALIRALRRLINSIYLPDVQLIYSDDDETLTLCHKFLLDPKWRTSSHRKFLCRRKDTNWVQVDGDVIRSKCLFSAQCALRNTLKNACCHQAYPELWPAVITTKAIDYLPRLSTELEKNVVNFQKKKYRNTIEQKYFYSLGHTLRVFEKMCS